MVALKGLGVLRQVTARGALNPQPSKLFRTVQGISGQHRVPEQRLCVTGPRYRVYKSTDGTLSQ